MKRDSIYRELDRILALCGVGLSALVIAGAIISRSRNPNILIAVSLVLIFCATWLCIRNRDSLKTIQLQTHGAVFLSSAAAFFLFFGLSVLSLHLRSDVYVRPILYFVCTALMASAVAIETLSSPPGRRSVFAILPQIIILGVSVQVSQLIIFPNMIGIDPWMHEWITSTIVATGHVQANTAYTALPLFHLEVASTMLLASLDYKLSVMLSVGLCFVIVGTLFTFLLGKRLISDKVGLLAALVLVTANSFIWLGSWTIPNTLGALLLLVGIYEILRLRDQNAARHIAIILLVMAAVILTHTLSAMAFAIAVLAGVVALRLHQRFHHSDTSNNLSLTLALAFVVGMLLWWINISGSFYALVSLFHYSAANFAQTASATSLSQSTAEQVFSFLGLYAFFALSLLGLLYMLSEKFGNARTLELVFMGVPMLLLTFSNVFGVFLLQERWAGIAQIFFAVPLALTLVLVASLFRSTTIKLGLVGTIVLCLSFVMILSPIASTDNHFLSPSQGTLALYSSEVQAFDTIYQNSTGHLFGDDYYMPALTFYHNLTQSDQVTLYQVNRTPNDLILLRSADIGQPITLTPLGDTVVPPAPQVISPAGSLVYDSGTVHAYRLS
jgi:hypothetical protein